MFNHKMTFKHKLKLVPVKIIWKLNSFKSAYRYSVSRMKDYYYLQDLYKQKRAEYLRQEKKYPYSDYTKGLNEQCKLLLEILTVRG